MSQTNISVNRKELNLTKKLRQENLVTLLSALKTLKWFCPVRTVFFYVYCPWIHISSRWTDWCETSVARNVWCKTSVVMIVPRNISDKECFTKQKMYDRESLVQNICYKDCISKHSVKRNVLWNIFFTIMFHTQLWSLMRNFCNKKSLIHNFCDKKSLMCNFCGKKRLVRNFCDKTSLVRNFYGKKSLMSNFCDKKS